MAFIALYPLRFGIYGSAIALLALSLLAFIIKYGYALYSWARGWAIEARARRASGQKAIKLAPYAMTLKPSSIPYPIIMVALTLVSITISGIPPLLQDASYLFSLSSLEVIARCLLAAVLLLLCFATRARVCPHAIALGLIIGSIIGFIYAYVQTHDGGTLLSVRACGGIDIFGFGMMSALVGILSLYMGLFYLLPQGRPSQNSKNSQNSALLFPSRPSLILGAMLLIASILSSLNTLMNGSRSYILGGFIMAVVIVASFIYKTKGHKNRALFCYLGLILAIYLLGFGASYAIVRPDVRDVLSYTHEEIDDIAGSKEGWQSTSLGHRILIYQEHIDRFLYSPFIGMDTKSLILYYKGLDPREMENKESVATLLRHRRMGKGHNDFLTIASRRGIVGLASYIAFIISLLYAVREGLRRARQMAFKDASSPPTLNKDVSSPASSGATLSQAVPKPPTHRLRDATLGSYMVLVLLGYVLVSGMGVDVFASMKEVVCYCVMLVCALLLGFGS